MQFDYGFLRGDDWSLQQQFDDLEVKCHLDREEYLNLVYAMYCLSLEKVDSQKAKRDVKLSNIEKRDIL